MRLFEIHDKVEQLMNELVDRETGELSEEAEAKLNELEVEWAEKAKAVALYIKGEWAEAAAIGMEAASLNDRAQLHQNRGDRLAKYLDDHFGQEITEPNVKVFYRKSKAVGETEPGNLEAVDPAYLRTKIPPPEVVIDKKKALPDLKEGKEIRGLFLEERKKLVIE